MAARRNTLENVRRRYLKTKNKERRHLIRVVQQSQWQVVRHLLGTQSNDSRKTRLEKRAIRAISRNKTILINDILLLLQSVIDVHDVESHTPGNVESVVLMKCLNAFQKSTRRIDLSHFVEVFARILLATKQDDFFSYNHVQSLIFFHDDPDIDIETQSRSGFGTTMLINLHLLYALSKLVRQGLGARRKPTMSEYSAALARYKAEGTLYAGARTVEESNAKYAEAEQKVNEIEALFHDPLSLFNECCLTIRRCLRYPKHNNLFLLPLPQLMCEKLMFPDLCREICEQMKGNC